MSSIVFSDFGDPAFAAEYARRRGGRAERVAGHIGELAGIGEGDRVVDLCCGPGLVAAQLAERVRATGEVIGIDASPAMISLARAAAQGTNVRFLEGTPTPSPHCCGSRSTMLSRLAPGRTSSPTGSVSWTSSLTR